MVRAAGPGASGGCSSLPAAHSPQTEVHHKGTLRIQSNDCSSILQYQCWMVGLGLGRTSIDLKPAPGSVDCSTRRGPEPGRRSSACSAPLHTSMCAQLHKPVFRSGPRAESSPVVWSLGVRRRAARVRTRRHRLARMTIVSWHDRAGQPFGVVARVIMVPRQCVGLEPAALSMPRGGPCRRGQRSALCNSHASAPAAHHAKSASAAVDDAARGGAGWVRASRQARLALGSCAQRRFRPWPCPCPLTPPCPWPSEPRGRGRWIPQPLRRSPTPARSLPQPRPR